MVVAVDHNMKMQKFHGGLYDKGRDLEIDGIFAEGDYLIYCEIEWEQDACREFGISIYAEMNALLTEIRASIDQRSIIEDLIKTYLVTNCDKKGISDYTHLGDGKIKRYVDYVFGYLVFYYKNDSSINVLEEKIRMNSLYGLEILPPHRDSFEFEITIK